jgi:hypothetical protein
MMSRIQREEAIAVSSRSDTGHRNVANSNLVHDTTTVCAGQGPDF